SQVSKDKAKMSSRIGLAPHSPTTALKLLRIEPTVLILPKSKKARRKSSLSVGVAGFEPTTSTSQMWRDTGLRYTPRRYHLFDLCGTKIDKIMHLSIVKLKIFSN